KRKWHVLRVLNALALYEKDVQGSGFKGSKVGTPEEKTLNGEPGTGNLERLMAEIRPIIEKIEKWASLGPTLKPYLAFIHAELERVTGEFKEARSLYLDAISAAHEQNFTFLEGHLNECVGEMMLRAGQGVERVYFAEAARLYRKCRAERKEIRLIEKHPDSFEEEKPSCTAIEEDAPKTLPDLDVDYLMKSSLAISAEIEQDALLKKIMNVVIESSGAQHGYLLIEEAGNLFVRAESHITEKQAVRTLNQKLDAAEGICKAIVRYVYRTGERVILNDALREGAFKDNPQVQRLKLRSVLCLPVIKQSRMIGILYLENRLTESVFTSEKTLMTELLTSQAAISFENATLLKGHRQAEQALRERESELRLIMDSTQALISYVDSSCRYRRVNEVYERWFGRTAGEVQGKHIRDVLGDAAWQAVHPYAEQALAGKPVIFEQELLLSGIGPRWIHAMYTPDRDESGRVRGFVVHAVDITELKRAEDQVKKSLREKEVLLKEIHHRVKNNLQIIHSMLNLQLPHVKDRQAIELFKESKNRVYSMALIHEKLYESESLAMINLSEYIRSLTANLFLSYGVSERAIRPKISVENITLDIDTVIPCALIINELVSNSLKHAFPDSLKQPTGKGEIGIDLRRGIGDKVILTVADNGAGLPDGFDIQNTRSLGLKLVSVLVKQLSGTVYPRKGDGAEFVITFEGKR
ncbi:MAG: PAS domain S-box protein, partial [Desulfobacteraceae bacterium]